MLLDEIRECFAATKNNVARKLDSLSPDFLAWAIKEGKEFGVAIEYEGAPVNEKFANCRIHSEVFTIAGNTRKCLVLACNREDLRYEFASVCAQFLDPGEGGSARSRIVANPMEWWEQWRSLMGNAVVEHQVYSVIAEMLVLEYLFKKDQSVEWTATKAGTKDIESGSESFEVKSTVVRYGATVTISSQFQLQQTKPLHLFFCRMEESPLGYSIDDVEEKLVSDGYAKVRIDAELDKLGFEAGCRDRKKKYKVLEIREYKVDKNFPMITAKSFVNGQIPNGVVQLTYTINLDSIPYTTVEI